MADPVPLIDPKALIERWEEMGGSFRIDPGGIGFGTGVFPVIDPLALEDKPAQLLLKRLLRPRVQSALLEYLERRAAGG